MNVLVDSRKPSPFFSFSFQVWEVDLATPHLRGVQGSYVLPGRGKGGGGHPKADQKHPRAHSSQGLQATVLTRTSAVLAYVHQTLEGYRSSLRQNACSVGVTIQLVMRTMAETTI